MASSFGKYQSGIEASTGNLVPAYAKMAEMQYETLTNAGKQFGKVLEEYGKQKQYEDFQDAYNKSASTKDISQLLQGFAEKVDPTKTASKNVEFAYTEYKNNMNQMQDVASKQGGKIKEVNKDTFRANYLKSAKSIIQNKKDLNPDLQAAILKDFDIEINFDTKPKNAEEGYNKMDEYVLAQQSSPADKARIALKAKGEDVGDATTPTQETLDGFNKLIKLENVTKEEEVLTKRKQEIEKILKSGNYKRDKIAEGTTALALKAEDIFNNAASVTTALQLMVDNNDIKQSDITPDLVDELIKSGYKNPLQPIASTVASFPVTAATVVFGDNINESTYKLVEERLKEFKSKASAQSGVGAVGGRGSYNIQDEVKNIDARLKKLDANRKVALDSDYNPATGKVEISPERKLKEQLTKQLEFTKEEAKIAGGTYDAGEYIQQQQLDRAEKKAATRDYYEKTYGRVPYNFDALFNAQSPDIQIISKGGRDFIIDSKGEAKELSARKTMSQEDISKERMFSFGQEDKNGNKIRDKNGDYVPQQIVSGSGVFVSGQISGDAEKVKKHREAIKMKSKALNILKNEIIPAFDRAGAKWSPAIAGELTPALTQLRSFIRPDVLGTGSQSDLELKKLIEDTPDPTKLFSVRNMVGGERANAQKLVQLLESAIEAEGEDGGFNVQIAGRKANASETVVAKLNQQKR